MPESSPKVDVSEDGGQDGDGEVGQKHFFDYAGKQKSRKLRYICRLFCKEIVRHNFPGLSTDELLERMIELSPYTEAHLK